MVVSLFFLLMVRLARGMAARQPTSCNLSRQTPRLNSGQEGDELFYSSPTLLTGVNPQALSANPTMPSPWTPLALRHSSCRCSGQQREVASVVSCQVPPFVRSRIARRAGFLPETHLRQPDVPSTGPTLVRIHRQRTRSVRELEQDITLFHHLTRTGSTCAPCRCQPEICR